jgi:hypothetical protein
VPNLSGAADYFAEVLKPNKDAFFGGPSTFASAFNFASSLYHFHEWLFVSFKGQLEAEFTATFPTARKFWKAVEAKDNRSATLEI